MSTGTEGTEPGVQAGQRPTSRRRRLTRFQTAAILIIVIFVGSVSYVTNAFCTHFVFEERFADGQDMRRINIRFTNFKDTNVTVRFVNDRDLMYRIEVDLYTFYLQLMLQARLVFQKYALRTSHNVRLDLQGDYEGYRARRLDITLGNRVSYDFSLLRSHSMNVSIVVDNGAKIADNEWLLDYSGTTYFKFTRDVNVTGDFRLTYSPPVYYESEFYLDIDLHEDLDGEVPTPKSTWLSHSGRWRLTVYPTYWLYHTSDRRDYPDFEIDLGYSEIHGRLRG